MKQALAFHEKSQSLLLKVHPVCFSAIMRSGPFTQHSETEQNSIEMRCYGDHQRTRTLTTKKERGPAQLKNIKENFSGHLK
ncbi:hypothetical protein JTE90_004198 [Oedothorax gibbosus]|uniref:Uncharacterized protein n=1 Tax=Oedothorax gibbosus TaxID=931172 RepID=A0AAV6V2A1_9ARAC|nr:hypothetical protein JTE90_004198 [Oedothorax gibbosus]